MTLTGQGIAQLQYRQNGISVSNPATDGINKNVLIVPELSLPGIEDAEIKSPGDDRHHSHISRLSTPLVGTLQGADHHIR